MAASNTTRWVLASAYALASTLALLALLPARLAMPLAFIALGWPLAFRLVPRNFLYGMRTSRTLFSTEEIWYRQNTISGVAMMFVGAVWLAVVVLR